MYSLKDKNVLQELKSENAQAFDTVESMKHQRKTEISGITHDLRNSVSVIHSALQVGAMKNPELLNNPMWNNATQNTKEMIDFLNRISKYRYSDEINPSPVGVCEFLNKLSSDCNGYISIENECEPTDTINADCDKLSYAFCEIISNAKDADCSISLCAYTKKNSVCFMFTTYGGSMDEEELSGAFEPFFSRKKDHHGLGLSIALSTVTAHNGTINISNMFDDLITEVCLYS